MDFEKFKEFSNKYKVVPVFEKITADLLTPVLAYIKLREKNEVQIMTLTMIRFDLLGMVNG